MAKTRSNDEHLIKHLEAVQWAVAEFERREAARAAESARERQERNQIIRKAAHASPVFGWRAMVARAAGLTNQGLRYVVQDPHDVQPSGSLSPELRERAAQMLLRGEGA